jgi:hypothetical protein
MLTPFRHGSPNENKQRQQFPLLAFCIVNHFGKLAISCQYHKRAISF